MQHPRFRSGELTTGFIAEEYPDGFHGAPASPELLRAIAAIAGNIATINADRARRIAGQLNGRPAPPGDWQVSWAARTSSVSLGEDAITVDGADVDLAFDYAPGDRTIQSRAGRGAADRSGRRHADRLRPRQRAAPPRSAAAQCPLCPPAALMIEKLPPDLSRLLICPMPGLLVALHVAEGDRVEPGQPLATVEAMKMENILRAEKAGTVKASMPPGDSLAVDAVILELE